MNFSELPQTLRQKSERAVARLPFEVPAEARWLFGLSDFAAAMAERHAGWLEEALRLGRFERAIDSQALALETAAALEGVADMAGLQHALRLIRSRHQLWVVWRHLVHRASLDETTAVLSALADVLIDAALTRVYAWACAADGQPTGGASGTVQQMVVLALGKLGARELNLSSDVDLILCYPETGTTGSGKTNQQFFVRVGQLLVQALDPVTEDGFVFRVDLRLRPFGASGPVAMHFAAIEDYYVVHGRDWERYALIKARPCAGDIAAGEELLSALRPFVYRRYLDFGALDALREMKARLLAERNNPHDVKLGPGGIRDVEFMVQVQQLVWAGRQLELQTPSLLTVLPRLAELGHLPANNVAMLERAYRFLRDVEHSLQAEADQQTQILPAIADSQARLALGLGFADFEEFSAALAAHRGAVSRLFDELIADDGVGDSPGRALWRQADDASAFAEQGFSDPEGSRDVLQGLITARDRPSVAAEGRDRLDRLMPALLNQVRLTANPDLALQRVVPVLRAVLRRSAYLALLRENPDTLAHFVRLTLESRWLADELARHPAFFDALLDERHLGALPDRATLNTELAALLARAPDEERALDVLREFKEHHVFNVALAQIRGTLPLMNVSDYLTWLAEAVLEQALQLAWRDSARRFPEYADRRDFLIVGFGKLGGIELGPGSDLDLVFVHDLPAAASQFLHRLVRRVLHVITVQTYLGTLYEVDMRLRPSGNAGTMVTSLQAFRDYELQRAWVWEHQALVRARPVAGDANLAERFALVRREVLCQPRDRAKLQAEVVSMRRRMSEHQPALQDVKRGSGGIVDIEFLVQYLVLAWASEYPELTRFSDNMRLLETIEAIGLLPASLAQGLREAYLALRSEWHRSVLDLPDDARAAHVLDAHRDKVAEAWSLLFGET